MSFKAQRAAIEMRESVAEPYAWLNAGALDVFNVLVSAREKLSEISGAQPMTLVNPLRRCDYCDRPNLSQSETCNSCGAPSNA